MTVAEATVDCRGKRCPQPVIDLARHIGDVPVGAVLGVVADDPAARVDIPAWCEMRDHDYAGEASADDGVPIFFVRRRH